MNKAWRLFLSLALFSSILFGLARLGAGCEQGRQTGGSGVDSGEDYADNRTDQQPPDDAGLDRMGVPGGRPLELGDPSPFGTRPSEILQRVSEPVSAVLQWQLREGQTAETNMTLNILYAEEPIFFVDYGSRDCEIGCDYIRIPVRIYIRTDDGLFDDTCQASLNAYGNGMMQVSSKPLYLSEMNGTYTAEMMLENQCNSENAVDDYESFYLRVSIDYRDNAIQGVVTGTAYRGGVPDGNRRLCKGGIIATWQ